MFTFEELGEGLKDKVRLQLCNILFLLKKREKLKQMWETVQSCLAVLAGVALLVGALSCTPKGFGLDSQLGHIPKLQVPPPGQGAYGEATD